MALTANINRPKGRRVLKASDFYRPRPKPIKPVEMDRETALQMRAHLETWVEKRGGFIVKQSAGTKDHPG